MHLALLVTHIRAEEKLLITAFRNLGVEPDIILDRDLNIDEGFARLGIGQGTPDHALARRGWAIGRRVLLVRLLVAEGATEGPFARVLFVGLILRRLVCRCGDQVL